ncbi:MAG: CBS domain-containing protein [Peptococcaceae bacterium]|nr:CBS domain-containing protein [Peptococcaceae bacterium]
MEKSVKDIMVPLGKYPTIPASYSVKEAIAALIKSMKSGTGQANTSLFVMENNTLVGVLGLREITKVLEPVVLKEGSYRGWTVSEKWTQPLFLKGLFTEKCKEIAELKVTDIMSPAARFLSINDSLLKAVHELVSNGFEVIPVRQDGRVAGMVGVMEILSEIAAIQAENTFGMDSGIVKTAG